MSKHQNILKLLVIGLLICGFLLRVFAFEQSIQFDSDFGRDSLFAVRILTAKPTLLGAQASVGGFYLGPLYFYALALLFLIFGYIPQIISLAFIFLNLLADYLLYRFLTRNISPSAGIFGLILFSFNPLLIFAARGATHIPMLPIITIISVMALYQALIKKQTLRHLISGLTFGLFFHVHFTSLLLLPGYFVAVLIWGGKNWTKKIYACIWHGLGMLIMLSPLILFDFRHGFITSQAFFKYLTASATGESITANLPHWSLSEKIINLAQTFTNKWYLQISLLVVAIRGLRQNWKNKNKNKNLNLAHLLSVLFITLCLFYFLYGGYLYSYYLVIPLTLGILLLAVGLAGFPSRLLTSVLLMSIAILVIPQIKPIYQAKFRTITNLSRIVHGIESHIDSTQPDSFTVFKDSQDGMTGLAYEYRFLLQRDGYLPMHELAYDQAEVLYLIQEDGMSDPLTLGNWEITQFNPQTSEQISSYKLVGNTVRVFALYK